MSVLLITTIGHLVSACIIGGAGILVLLQNPKKNVNRTFFFGVSAVAVYATTLAIGINLEPSKLAYSVWMFNLVNIFTAAGFFHFSLTVLKLEVKARFAVWAVYAIGLLIIVASVLEPQLFLPELTPKLFTKSYLTAGPLYVAMIWYFMVVALGGLLTMLVSYFRHKEQRRQLEYFIAAAIFGFGFGMLDFLLVFDIPASPLYGMFFGLYVVPIAYGILSDELLDIRVVFKRALLYSLAIGGITAVLTSLILLNNILVRTLPWVEFWTVPIFTAAASFIIGRIFWKQLIENERVKYEFITVATHKLRTPLTQISWGVRTLLDNKEIDPETRDITEHIQSSSNRLIELTNILFETTEEDAQEYAYTKEEVNLRTVTENTLKRLTSIIGKKNMKITVEADESTVVQADIRRITSVIEVFIENAISYTSADGSITISIKNKRKNIRYAVTDTGIGFAPEEKKNIFLRFYRTDAAKRVDTEGVGLGLAMSKNIIKKHKGKIGAESEGLKLGSTFWFEIPKK